METEHASPGHRPRALWYTHYGLLTMVYSLWSTHYGLLTMVYLLWSTHQVIGHVPRRHTREVSHGQYTVAQVLSGRESERTRLGRSE